MYFKESESVGKVKQGKIVRSLNFDPPKYMSDQWICQSLIQANFSEASN